MPAGFASRVGIGCFSNSICGGKNSISQGAAGILVQAGRFTVDLLQVWKRKAFHEAAARVAAQRFVEAVATAEKTLFGGAIYHHNK